MIQYAITFLILALVAAFLGFGGIAAVSVEAARIVFGVFIVMFIVTAIMHLGAGKSPKI